MDKAALFAKLSDIGRQETDEDASPPDLDADELWRVLFGIARDEPHVLPVFFGLLQMVTLISPLKPSPVVDAKLQEAEGDAGAESLRELVNLLPVLDLSACGRVFACLVKSVERTFDVARLQALLATAKVERCTSDALQCMGDVFMKQGTPACAVAIAPFAAALAAVDEGEVQEFCDKFIAEKLNGSVEDQVAALFLFESMAEVYADEEVPKGVFESMVPLLVSSNEVLCFRAHKAMRAMIENGVFDDHVHICAVLKQYSEYGEARMDLFFKLVERFLDNVAAPKMKVLQEIFDFVCGALKSETSAVSRAKSLECLSQLAAIGKNLIEDVYEEGLEVAKVLIKEQHKKCYTQVANFMLAVSKVYPETTLKTVMEHVPMLADSLFDDESGTKKQRMERAESLAAIVQGNAPEEIVVKLADFTMKTLENVTGSELFYICSVILALKNNLKEQQGVEFFSKLEGIARTEIDSKKLNALLHTMKKLLNVFNIDAAQFVADLLDGKLAFIGGLPLYSCYDQKTMIFYFIAAYIRKFPLKSGAIASKLIGYVSQVSEDMLPVILEPIEAALHAGIVSFDDTKVLYDIVMGLLESAFCDDEGLCACVDILSKIGKTSPDIYNVPAVLEMLSSRVNSDDEDFKESSAYQAIVRFALEIYTCKAIKAEVNADLLKAVIGSLPMGPEVSSMEEIMMLLVKLLDDAERFKDVVVPSAIAISELLMLKKTELDEYNFTPDTLKALKETLKRMLKADKTLERQITKTFQSRPKLNRFSAMLKQI